MCKAFRYFFNFVFVFVAYYWSTFRFYHKYVGKHMSAVKYNYIFLFFSFMSKIECSLSLARVKKLFIDFESLQIDNRREAR